MVKWIKIVTNVFDDEKIRLIETLPDADTLIVIWFKLLTMAGKCNDSGLIYLMREVPYNEEMLATIINRPINTIRLALNEFVRLGMIGIENNFIAILNWEKHQKLDKLEMSQKLTRERVQKHREKQRLISNVTLQGVTVTQTDKDIDKDIDIDKNLPVSTKPVNKKQKESLSAEQIELRKKLMHYFAENYSKLYSKKLSWTKKEIFSTNDIIKKYDPTDITSKMKILRSKCKTNADYYTFLPSVLLNQWNKLVETSQYT